ncbi:uncharacterized protein TM35_000025110 [Trypanosoma theileri]|uniref:WW domain-containing protein n=1 Tax=Trypanosoma theileri TaxID=67003 RepID=A0A1X0P8N1_9TRYP|nr:uncharacterized protein TM35_000025110 [Trypanosoma theileri]ORC93185.1 hypothetical protein TM35_000025110 [Trypanosoma theileri]
MVVLRLIGDEWSWEDRIALAMPPQKTFTMCIPLLVSKLGVEKWSGLTLYRTEGRPPKYCRPTVPLDMASSPQKERLRDGTVMWVRAAPSLVQQERERVFQSSLEDWRKKNGLSGISDDGSDVKRFIEELSSHLNKADAKDLNEQEQEARNTIEGEEHRWFAHIIYSRRTMVEMESEEQKCRQNLEEEYSTMAKQYYRSFLLSLYREKIQQLEALEKKGRHTILEEYDSTTRLLYKKLHENLQAVVAKESNLLSNSSSKKKSEEDNDKGEEEEKGKKMKGSNENIQNTEEILLMVRTELQRLLEPVKQMYYTGLEDLKKQRDLISDRAETFLSHLREYIVNALRFIHNEAWRLGASKPLPVISPAVTKTKELKLAMERQQLLLTQLLGEYQNLELHVSADLNEISMKTTLDALYVTQLNMCRYLDTLHEEFNVNVASSHKVLETSEKSDKNLSPIQKEIIWKDKSDLKQSTSLTISISTNNYLQLGEDGVLRSMIHIDTYNILLAFVSRYMLLPREGYNQNLEDVKNFINKLVLQCGSVQGVADELVWTYRIVSHPMRKRFLRITEVEAPHLCAVVDLMLHLYTGSEVELLLWIKPELTKQGIFTKCVDDNGVAYYYHSAADMSQWVQPTSISVK